MARRELRWGWVDLDPIKLRFGETACSASTRGVMNDALAVHFAEKTLATAFVARWCVAQKVEIVDGVHRVRDDEPTPRIGAALHRTP